MRALPAPAAATAAASRARRSARIATTTYWGRPVPGFGDPDGAAAARRPRARRARRQPHRPRVHRRRRRRLRRLPDGGAPPDRLRQHPDVAAHATTACGCTDAYILAAVRCAPPDNKPLPEEIARCLDHLDAEVDALPRVRVVVALGKIAFDAWLQLLRRRGVSAVAAPAVRARRRRRRACGDGAAHAGRLLSPEPAEHQHGQADAADDGGRVRKGADAAAVSVTRQVPTSQDPP